MTSLNVERVLREIASLTYEERQQIRRYLESDRQEAGTGQERAALHQRLVEEGVLAQAPKRVTDFSAYAHRRPIQIKGKPLSQTILEERR